jgi:sialic acid synthase SpsE
MLIGKRKVGAGCPPVVIAEIGINHGGSLAEAKKLVDAAASVGVEVIKHQTHIVDDEMSPRAKEVVPAHTQESIYDIMAGCALDEDEEIELMRYVQSLGIEFISTPFSRAAADRLERMGIPAYKIGSGECNNLPLIEHIAKFGKPMIVSTGMNSLESVVKTVEVLDRHGVEYALLHTTNLYPTPEHLVRLGAMQELAARFPGVIVGLSDHTTNNIACIGAMALGALIVERHFTDSMTRLGPDISCSMDPKACRDLIEASQILFRELGGSKAPCAEEYQTSQFAFATVVTIRDIECGEAFSESNLWVKRPGTGAIPASMYQDILGKRAARALKSDQHLSPLDIA